MTRDAARPASTLLHIAEPVIAEPVVAPAVAASSDGVPLLRLGFRPFYLLAAAAGALLPLLWIGLLTGTASLQPVLPGVLWHAHEMLFGFVVAAIVGFLFTAGRTWTGLPTPTGGFLAAFALLWLSARVTALTGPYALFLLLDAAFLPLAAAVFFDLVMRSRNHRNLPMAVLLMLLAAANLAFHAAQRQVLTVQPMVLLQTAVLLIVAVQAIVAGRVIPAFIRNAVPGSAPITHARLEHALLPLTASAVVLWVLAPGAAITVLALGVLAALHAARLALWRPWVARGRPILWILPAAYAWMPLGLALLAAACAGTLPTSLGVHALAAGSMGALIVGMMSRTARGHTGRLLQAGRRERWAYGLVLLGAALRVAAPLVPGAAGSWWLGAAALLWSAAFMLLLWTLAPWLLSPRLDGKAG
jgi:uncharacterized protein involved in response to NO